jgi:hypothetical protein
MPDGTAGDHEAGVEGTAGDTTKGVPCAVVEPIPEAGEAILNEVLGCAEVEPGVDCGRWLLAIVSTESVLVQ